MVFARLILAPCAAATLFGGAALAAGRGESPVVVELYTSQGCSGCLEASAYAGDLAERSGVLLLSFDVDYWDYLGWKDTFAKPAFVERQRAYTEPLDNVHPYTPQMVVDGHVDAEGFDRDFVDVAIDYCFAHIAHSPPVTLARDGDVLTVTIGDGDKPAEDADVWLVAYEPGMHDVAIHEGENADQRMPHYNVVDAIEHVGAWNGEPTVLNASIQPGVSYAVLVQRAGQGAMIAAATE